MKKSISLLLVSIALLTCVIVPVSTMTGCKQSTATIVYQSLFAVESGVNAAYAGYNDGVLRGTISTNSFATISKDYGTFQSIARAANAAAQSIGNNTTNTIAPASMISLGQKITTDISNAK